MTVLVIALALLTWLFLLGRVATHVFVGTPARAEAILDSLRTTGSAEEEDGDEPGPAGEAPAGEGGSMQERLVRSTVRKLHHWKLYRAPAAFFALIAGCHLTVLAMWGFGQLTGHDPFAGRLDPVVVMALFGGMVWAGWELMTRADTGDLGPNELWLVGFRALAAGPIGYAFSLLSLGKVPELFAFVAAAFPLKEVRRLLRYWTLKRAETPVPQAQTDAAPPELRQAIQGITAEHMVRLAEIRVHTVVDLAYTHPVFIMMRTGYQPSAVLDWCDQALWALYIGDAGAALTRRGLRTALEAAQFYESHCRDADPEDWAADEEVTAIAAVLEVSPADLARLLGQIYGDPYLDQIWSLWGNSPMPPAGGCGDD